MRPGSSNTPSNNDKKEGGKPGGLERNQQFQIIRARLEKIVSNPKEHSEKDWALAHATLAKGWAPSPATSTGILRSSPTAPHPGGRKPPPADTDYTGEEDDE